MLRGLVLAVFKGVPALARIRGGEPCGAVERCLCVRLAVEVRLVVSVLVLAGAASDDEGAAKRGEDAAGQHGG